MANETESQNEQNANAKPAKTKPVNKQKFTEKQLKDMGLDPVPYGYPKK